MTLVAFPPVWAVDVFLAPLPAPLPTCLSLLRLVRASDGVRERIERRSGRHGSLGETGGHDTCCVFGLPLFGLQAYAVVKVHRLFSPCKVCSFTPLQLETLFGEKCT